MLFQHNKRQKALRPKDFTGQDFRSAQAAYDLRQPEGDLYGRTAAQGGKMIYEKVLNLLELNKVTEKVKRFLSLEMGKGTLDEERPAKSFEEMRERLLLTREADVVLTKYGADPVASYDDPQAALQKAEKQITLAISGILKVARILRSARLFKKKIAQLEDELPQLKRFASLLFIDKNFEDDVERCFISEEQVSDEASANLKSIRKSIRKVNEQIKVKLSSILRDGRNSKYIQDFFVTERNGRYVIPVKAEYKNSVKGMLHDQSSSGSTVYIEPEEVLQLNNELRLLQLKEKEEIERILQAFTSRVGGMADEIRLTNDILIKADVAFAKAKYAHDTKSVLPLINSEGKINILRGRHPLIDKEKIVPIDISLGKSYSFLVISGPNTGGKTVTLKLCGLFTLMAMCGLFLPASEGTEISFFKNVFCDIGDEQSIENNLSTFSSHLRNIIEICECVDVSSLVLIDEIGAGTDPAEGAALALSIFEYLLGKNCKGIVTTHYNELKEYAFLNERSKNASMEFDPVNLKPTFRLNIGIPGSSNALEISKKLGLREEIISSAYGRLSKDKIAFEKVLKSAQEAMSEAEARLREAESIKAEFQVKLDWVKEEERRLKELKENALKNAKIEAKRIIAEAQTQSEQLIEELKKIIKSAELSEYDLSRARQIRRKLEDSKYSIEIDDGEDIEDMEQLPPDVAEVGQKAYIKSLSGMCEIVSISRNREDVRVRFGGIEIDTKLNDLFLPKRATVKKEKRQKVSLVSKISPQGPVKTEINLLGRTVLEALEEADEFLNNCSIMGISECKIIHGLGTGALRKAIWEYLKKHPLVKSFRPGEYGEGEKGVTIVKLK